MECLVISGGIYPDYEIAPAYDLLNYVELKENQSKELFDALCWPFVNGIANWTDMNFDQGLHGYDALSYALKSSIDGNNGRIRIVYHEDNSTKISSVFAEIVQQGNYEKANTLLINWLYNYTTKNPENPWERLIIATK